MSRRMPTSRVRAWALGNFRLSLADRLLAFAAFTFSPVGVASATQYRAIVLRALY